MSDERAGANPLSFEEALEGLEAIVGRLEGGEAGLEEAITLFEEGQRLLAHCRERLAVAQGRIDELTASQLPAPATAENEREPF